MTPSLADEAGTSLDALRRRLYEPDATEADFARYRARVATQVPAQALDTVRGQEGSGRSEESEQREEASGPRAGAARPPVRRRLPVLLAALAVATAAVIAVSVVARPATVAPKPPSPTALAIPAAGRAAFIRALDAGRSAEVADYFYRHPDSRPAEVRTLTRADTEEHSGTGDQFVQLGPSTEADHGGRLTVVVVLADDGDVRWQLLRPVVLSDATRFRQQVVATRTSTQPGGMPFTATARYTGLAPNSLEIRTATPGARWDALIVFSD